jgi:hypothetical protein
MKLTFNDIVSARLWAEANHGDDDVLDVFQWKLLALVAQTHEENAGYHQRQVDQCRGLMAEIESRFKVEGDEF